MVISSSLLFNYLIFPRAPSPPPPPPRPTYPRWLAAVKINIAGSHGSPRVGPTVNSPGLITNKPLCASDGELQRCKQGQSDTLLSCMETLEHQARSVLSMQTQFKLASLNSTHKPKNNKMLLLDISFSLTFLQ